MFLFLFFFLLPLVSYLNGSRTTRYWVVDLVREYGVIRRPFLHCRTNLRGKKKEKDFMVGRLKPPDWGKGFMGPSTLGDPLV